MRRHGNLGSRRIPRRLDELGVCHAAIPLLEPGYEVIGVETVSVPGRAPKDYIVFPDGRRYIAKKPVRMHTGFRECATEYLIAELGAMLPVRVARGRIARLPTPHGAPPDVRFLSRVFTRPGEMLVHGVELVAQIVEMKPAVIEREIQSKTRERELYSIDFVDDVLDESSPDPECHEDLRGALIRMLAFDALLGAVDRHASNWGVIQPATGGRPRFSPVFDTARGLLLNRSDEDLRKQELGAVEKFIEGYASRSKPLIGVPGNPECNHFELMEFLANQEKYRKCAISVVLAYDPRRAGDVLHRYGRRILSPVRLRMIDRLLRHRWARLKKICRLP